MTDGLLHADWRIYPAALFVAAGLALVIRGVVRQAPGLRRPVTDPRKGGAMVRAFRSVIVGVALAAVGVGWWCEAGVLVGLALAIGAEEALETSVVIGAMNHGGPRS